MDESQYQLGIRKMSTHELVSLVIAYRNELESCRLLCKAFTQENFAQDVMHKVICGYKEAHLSHVIEDYEWALKSAEKNDVGSSIN